MDDETRKELNDIAFELWAVRAVVVQLMADKLDQFKNPAKAADLMASRVYAAHPDLSEPSQIRLSELIVSILDEATNSLLHPDPNKKENEK